MKEENYFYKGYDIMDTSKSSKIRYEYFNPYEYNFSSNSRRVIDVDYRCTHTNQDNKRK